MGRGGQLARYPIHWHLLTEFGRGQYFKSSSIKNSKNRAAVIHGTDFVQFEDNVVFEHPGHGIFLEDGSEEKNVFRHNLVIGTRRPTFPLLDSDHLPRDPGGFQNQAPAAFWITNPNNVFEDNVVAGADGTGYWFALPGDWMGDSGITGLAPNNYFVSRGSPKPLDQNLGSFDGNMCHSSFMALDMNDSIEADVTANGRVRQNVPWRPFSGVQTFHDFQVYSCHVGLYAGNGIQAVRHERAALADNTWQIVLASHDIVSNSVVVHDSQHGLWPSAPAPFAQTNPRRSIAVVLYDGAADLQNVHFVGFDAASSSSILWAQGAARRRTSWKMSGVTFASAGGVGAEMALDDVQLPPASPGDTVKQHDPRFWGFSIDNPDGKLLFGRSVVFPPTHRTVVSNHPMVHVLTQDIAIPPLGSTPVNAFASQHRFDYLRILATDFDSFGNPVQVDRLSLPDLKFTREQAPNPSVVYENRWQVDPYKQMALIADDTTFRYRLVWLDHGTNTPTQPVPQHVQVIVGEMRPGDAVILGLEGYANVTNVPQRGLSSVAGTLVPPQKVALQPVLSMTALTNASVTSFYRDTSTQTLWLKIMEAANSIPIEDDGRGQLILLDF